jgi:hypothetical protein
MGELCGMESDQGRAGTAPFPSKQAGLRRFQEQLLTTKNALSTESKWQQNGKVEIEPADAA